MKRGPYSGTHFSTYPKEASMTQAANQTTDGVGSDAGATGGKAAPGTPSVAAVMNGHPQPGGVAVAALAACVDACFACGAACTACADACLAEADVAGLARCIRLNLDCADVCVATGRLVARQTECEWELLRRQIEACQVACELCAGECELHASMHAHCAACATACAACEDACRQVLVSAHL